MKNIKTNPFVMTLIKIIAIMAGCLGVYYILCTCTNVAFTLANAEMWVGIGTIAVLSVLVTHLFKERREQELAAA